MLSSIENDKYGIDSWMSYWKIIGFLMKSLFLIYESSGDYMSFYWLSS